MDTSPRYRNWMLTVLAATLAFSYVDRYVLGLVLQDIKADLALSDTQLGLITGIAFAFFYAVMGVPIARWADRGNRVAIVSSALALWSVAAALCGAVGSFAQLIAARVAVAVGEAGCIPPSHSLIADTYNRQDRPRAMARYMLGGPASLVIGFFAGGWIAEACGWRMAFLILGLPGIPLAVLVWLTVREPRRFASAANAVPPPRFSHVCVLLWSIPTFRHLLACVSLVYFFGSGLNVWQPAFFIRTYGLGTGELGTWLTVIFGFGGLVGTYFGGEWAARHARGNEKLQLKVMAAMYCGFGVVSSLTYVSPSAYWAFLFLAIGSVGIGVVNGPLFAMIQSLVPGRMRAVSVALVYLIANLTGVGLGPLLVGVLSDVWSATFGADALRYALLVLYPGYFWCGWHLLRAVKTIDQDLNAPNKDAI